MDRFQSDTSGRTNSRLNLFFFLKFKILPFLTGYVHEGLGETRQPDQNLNRGITEDGGGGGWKRAGQDSGDLKSEFTLLTNFNSHKFNISGINTSHWLLFLLFGYVSYFLGENRSLQISYFSLNISSFS